MSEEGISFWATLVEKAVGITLVILSIILFYFTSISTATLNQFAGLFVFVGVVVLIGGGFLIITKPRE
ncbi:MAG: hypothetical protein ACBZ72_13650 [Candidatus Bathyarchaeia archaeon]|jgi:hypothetical protein